MILKQNNKVSFDKSQIDSIINNNKFNQIAYFNDLTVAVVLSAVSEGTLTISHLNILKPYRNKALGIYQFLLEGLLRNCIEEDIKNIQVSSGVDTWVDEEVLLEFGFAKQVDNVFNKSL